jgi:hypothetical protein
MYGHELDGRLAAQAVDHLTARVDTLLALGQKVEKGGGGAAN